MNQRHRLHVYTWKLGKNPEEDPANNISTYPADKYREAYLDFLKCSDWETGVAKLILVDLDNSEDTVLIDDSRISGYPGGKSFTGDPP